MSELKARYYSAKPILKQAILQQLRGLSCGMSVIEKFSTMFRRIK